MAAIQVKNGQVVTSTVDETEVQLAVNGGPTPSKVAFLAPTGTVQVTTGPRGGTGIIGGSIRGFVLADGRQEMTASPASTGGTSIFIKGTVTIFFTW